MDIDTNIPNYSTNTMTSSEKRWLIAIIFLGLLVRLMMAYIQPAFLDEGFVYYVAKSGIASAIKTLEIDTHPPTYNILIYPLVKCTTNIFLLRLPSALMSLGSIYLSFVLLRRFIETREALWLTAIYTFSYQLCLTDAQLRTYSPLTLTMTAVWLGMLDIRQYGSPFALTLANYPRLRWPLFALCGMSGASLHILGALILFSCGLSALSLPSRTRFYTIISLILGVIPVTFWLVYSRLTTSYQFPSNETGLTLSHILNFLAIPVYLTSVNIITDIPAHAVGYWELFKQLALYIVCGISVLMWVSFYRGYRHIAQKNCWGATLMFVNVIVPPLLLTIAATTGKMAYTQTRYALPMTIPYLTLAFCGLSETSRRQIYRCLVAFALFICAIFPFYPSLWNQSWTETLEYINKIKQPNDIIAINPPYTSYSFAMAYDPENISFTFSDDYVAGMFQKPSQDKLPAFILDASMLDDSLLRDLRGYRIILIMCQERTSPTSAKVLYWFDRYYDLVDEHHFYSTRTWANINTYVIAPKPELVKLQRKGGAIRATAK